VLLSLQALSFDIFQPGLSSINDRERQDAEKARRHSCIPARFFPDPKPRCAFSRGPVG
jgi:hypothetical protein